MASLYCNNNQVRDSSFSKTYYGTRSCSKAQASLSKILHLISTIPAAPENDPNPLKKRVFDIDLNLRLGSFLDDDESEEKPESLAENSFVGKNPNGQEEEETEEIQGKTATDASSDVTEMQKSDELKSGTEEGEVKTTALDLLIEAAELISERDRKEDEIEKLDEFTINDDGDDDDVSPVVRSKRGRCQVLPRRFRDSVLEPWKKRPQKSTAVVVSSKKRRSRSKK